MINNEEIQKKYNCRIRFKSSKNGQIKNVFRRKSEISKTLKDLPDLQDVLIAGFDYDNDFHLKINNIPNPVLALLLRNIESVSNTLYG